MKELRIECPDCTIEVAVLAKRLVPYSATWHTVQRNLNPDWKEYYPVVMWFCKRRGKPLGWR